MYNCNQFKDNEDVSNDVEEEFEASQDHHIIREQMQIKYLFICRWFIINNAKDRVLKGKTRIACVKAIPINIYCLQM